MAFTEAQKLTICTILVITPSDLVTQLEWLGTKLTDEVETAVEAELLRWTSGAGTDFVRVHPNVRNFGAEIDPSRERVDIKQNIAVLLQFNSLITNTINRTVRG